MLSGLYFEAADCYVLCYCLSNYSLQGHQVAVNMTWDQDGHTFVVKCEALKRTPAPLLVDL